MHCESLNGAITTPHPLASEVGRRVLIEGGTAIDAMIAAGAALASVFPHMTGIGGDALWLLYDNRVRGVMGIGQSGSAAPDCIQERGVDSMLTTAGAVASWQLARDISIHDWGSTLPLARLLDDAVSLAETGSDVTQSHAFWIQQRKAWLAEQRDLKHLTEDAGGVLLRIGQKFKQTQLAQTLSRLRDNGLMDFYNGQVAEELARGFSQLSVALGKQDLLATTAHEVELVKVRYRDGDYYNFPAPSQGFFTAQALSSLNAWDLRAFGSDSADYYHLMVEAIKGSLQQRNQILCDPAFSPLDSQALACAGKRLHLERAAPWRERGKPADTVWLAATDQQGRTACLMQSLFHDFGSGCMVGDTGVLWHNRGAGFSHDRQHPNRWASCKRPAHTLNPSCYIADQGHRYFFGSQGGDGQPQTQLVLATQLIDFQKPIADAIRAPRFLQGRSFFGASESLKLEQSLSAEIMQDLRSRGHDVEELPSLSAFTGQAGILIRHGVGLDQAVHDPRGEGVSLAVPTLR